MSSSHPVKTPKKLIEVALPLNTINVASSREKSIRHGHPSTLHLWWARRPLAAARAVIFGQMVNDPSWKWELEHPGEIPPNNIKATWAASRKRLFSILEELVKWESTTNEEVLERARAEIRKSWRETCELNKDHPQADVLFNSDLLPAFHDPFAGGGTIPLEAVRLGLDTFASDLNPVAVTLNKAMVELTTRFSGRSSAGPVSEGPQTQLSYGQWTGAMGMAEDVRRYGAWILKEARNRLADCYPSITLPKRLGGGKATVLTWLWCRTVVSPNPAANGAHIPLVKSLQLSAKKGRECWLVPEVAPDRRSYKFTVSEANQFTANGTVGARGAVCVLTNSPIPLTYIRSEGLAGRMGHRLMAAVVATKKGKAYVAASEIDEPVFSSISVDPPDSEILHWSGCTNVVVYGMKTFMSLFNKRQQLALSIFCELVNEVRETISADAARSGFDSDGVALESGGTGARAYAEAISVYLTCAVGRAADYWNTLTSWESGGEFVAHTFTKHALPMIWDYGEVNPIHEGGGSWESAIEWVTRVVEKLPARGTAKVLQLDAARASPETAHNLVVSTDPPYYDNVPYSNLSDFFYIWMRQCLRTVYPNIFSTLQTPKADELVASHSLYADIDDAMLHFTSGMTAALRRIHENAHEAVPVTIYYAFKQSDSSEDETSSSGWESFLSSVVAAGFAVTGTWPVRTERSTRGRAIGSNALASSIVLVCRRRPENAETISRRAFQREINQVLPEALDEMTKGAEGDHSPVAPVDLSQAIIGPGMAVFSKHAAVLESDGTPMTVKTALQLINRFLAEDDFDHDTQFCLHWFEQYGWNDGKFGEADTLARAKGTAVEGVKQAGVLFATAGIVRLLKWSDYPSDWDPATDTRLPIWEALHQLIRVFKTDGETGAGTVLSVIEDKGEAVRQLAYRLYTLCERAGWAEDARAYNEIITSWSAIESAATAAPKLKQGRLFA